MKKCLMIKGGEEPVKAQIHLGMTEYEGIEYLVVKCPNPDCKIQIMIPTCTIRTLLAASKKKLAGVV